MAPTKSIHGAELVSVPVTASDSIHGAELDSITVASTLSIHRAELVFVPVAGEGLHPRERAVLPHGGLD